jgi:hypothetical protein
MEIETAFMPSAAASAPPPQGDAKLWQDGDFSFGDLLDIVNPLQHIPIVGTIYRALTGDKIGNLPRLIGSFALGGTLGLVGGMVSVAVKDMTGRDPGEHLAALVGLEPDGPPAPAALAEQPPAPPAPAAEAPEAAVPAAPETVAAVAPKPIPVVPDHPPMPLARAPRISLPDTGTADAAQSFLAQQGAATYQPGATSGRGAPVALQSTLMPRPRAVTPAAERADVPKQMMEALDKYARLQTSRTAPGAQVDLVQ